MMLEERSVNCPYCGEVICVILDPSTGTGAYIEDCQVCCRPIVFRLDMDFAGTINDVSLQREDD